jgi:hypothetical protein
LTDHTIINNTKISQKRSCNNLSQQEEKQHIIIMPQQGSVNSNETIQDEFQANFPLPADQEMVENSDPILEDSMEIVVASNNMNDIPIPPTPPPPLIMPATALPNLNLAAIRVQFNPEGML